MFGGCEERSFRVNAVEVTWVQLQIEMLLHVCSGLLVVQDKNTIMVKVIKCVRRSNDRPHNPSRLFADSTGVPPPPLEGTTSCLPAAWFVEVNSFCL